jgi:hypothetical protein
MIYTKSFKSALSKNDIFHSKIAVEDRIKIDGRSKNEIMNEVKILFKRIVSEYLVLINSLSKEQQKELLVKELKFYNSFADNFGVKTEVLKKFGYQENHIGYNNLTDYIYDLVGDIDENKTFINYLILYELKNNLIKFIDKKLNVKPQRQIGKINLLIEPKIIIDEFLTLINKQVIGTSNKIKRSSAGKIIFNPVALSNFICRVFNVEQKGLEELILILCEHKNYQLEPKRISSSLSNIYCYQSQNKLFDVFFDFRDKRFFNINMHFKSLSFFKIG